MGCVYPSEKMDIDIETEPRGTIGDLEVSKVPPVEFENCIPDDLKLLLKSKFRQLYGLGIRFYEISKEEFDANINHNFFANQILKLYSQKLDLIQYEPDVYYSNLNPIKVILNQSNQQFYQGGFNSKGQCHGRGAWVGGFNIYIGNFKNDEFSGNGLFITQQGNYYFGQWLNGKYDGYGTLVIGNKIAYRGFFKNGKKEGIGEEKYWKGDNYDGSYYNGEINGKGKYSFVDGSYYDGNFRNSKYNGYGEIKMNEGNRLTGDFKEGKLDGIGNFEWNDGTKFNGNYMDDKRKGRGTYTWKDGKSYTGYWNGNTISSSGIYNEIPTSTIIQNNSII